jgi:pimeloyl-ACP methyl ester carboxylesterase
VAPRGDPARRLVAEAISPREYLRLRRSRVFAGVDIDGDGLPVLLIPGFLTDDGFLSVMGRWLHRTGHRPYRSGLGRNVGCAERGVSRLARRVEEIADREGRPVALVGHSRGGHFARVVAIRRPQLVAGVVTLGTPPMNPRAVHVAAAGPAVAVTLLGTLGAPGLMRSSCFIGSCCARFRTELAGPFPRGVPYVAVYSKSDPIVDWRRMTDRAAERVEVHASHLGIVVNHHAYAAVAEALHRFSDQEAT